jgi:hypothetical protein
VQTEGTLAQDPKKKTKKTKKKTGEFDFKHPGEMVIESEREREKRCSVFGYVRESRRKQGDFKGKSGRVERSSHGVLA